MYDPQAKARRAIVDYFERHRARLPGVADRVRAFFDAPCIDAAVAMLTGLFERHRPGDLEALETAVGCFASKRIVLQLVEALLDDPAALERVAAASYPHPIGFDKLVLHHHRQPGPARGYKLRLHLYWRSPQQVAAERPHVHRFEMASTPITGELTNHRWRVVGWEPEADRLPGLAVVPAQPQPEPEVVAAYSGYQRDPDGSLHKRYLGRVRIQWAGQQTFVPGQVYGQVLEDVHYVETNAETGHTNGDFCSTIYVHGPPLVDTGGRTIPVLIERERLPHDDTLIEPIAPVAVADLEASLRRYAQVLRESLAFYAWLYDPKYGRNLSVGMVAGYLLSERLDDPNTIDLWSQRYPTCKRVLAECSQVLAELVQGKRRLDDLPADDRARRYYQQLLAKADAHQGGPGAWLLAYGDLRKEMWRYLGALLGDYARNPDTRVLKPVWELTCQRLAGGAHYGHISAMLDAAFAAAELIQARFRDQSPAARAWLGVEHKGGEGPVSRLDRDVQATIQQILREHFPDHAFAGEEGEAQDDRGARYRFLVDPLDGTRNFLAGNKAFCVSIAAQERTDTGWSTTDAVISLPAHREIYWAERGEGAFLIDADGDETKLAVGEPAEARDGALVDLSVRGLGAAGPGLRRRLAARGMVDRRLGTSAVALAMVSGTGHHAAVQTAAPHDVAAGVRVAHEAGATVGWRSFVREGRRFTVYVAAAGEDLAQMLRADVDAALAEAGLELDDAGWGTMNSCATESA